MLIFNVIYKQVCPKKLITQSQIHSRQWEKLEKNSMDFMVEMFTLI